MRSKQARKGTRSSHQFIKSIERRALENSDDPFLVAMAERARAVQESFEDRQNSTEGALAELLKQIERDDERKKIQAAKGLDGLSYFVPCKLTESLTTARPSVERCARHLPNLPSGRAVKRSYGNCGRKSCLRSGRGGRSQQGHRARGQYCYGSTESNAEMSTKHWKDEEDFKARVLKWAGRLEVKVRSLTVRPMSNKWASCSTAGSLNFNAELLTWIEPLVITSSFMNCCTFRCRITANFGKA